MKPRGPVSFSFVKLGLAFAVTLLGWAPPASAQDPCVIRPFDGTNEDGVGAAVGDTPREFCSEMPTIPSECTDDGWYWVTHVAVNLTRTGGATNVPHGVQVRRGPAGGPPNGGAPVAGPNAATAPGVPTFPSSATYVTSVFDASGRFSVGFDAVGLTSACVTLNGPDTQGNFLTSDESVATPVRPCFTGINGGDPTDNCLNGAPDLRAAGLGVDVTPIGGRLVGGNEVPPVNTPATGTARMREVSAGTYDIEVVHDVVNPTAAHIHQAPHRVGGSIIVNLGNPTSPIVLNNFSLTPTQIADLQAGNLYVNVHSATNPGGEIRAQLDPATLIFADGFESGDTSAWSSTVP